MEEDLSGDRNQVGAELRLPTVTSSMLTNSLLTVSNQAQILRRKLEEVNTDLNHHYFDAANVLNKRSFVAQSLAKPFDFQQNMVKQSDLVKSTDTNQGVSQFDLHIS